MIPTTDYPVGKGAIKSRYVAGALVFYHPSTGAELYRIDPAVSPAVVIAGVTRTIRTRFTIAQINAGATLLPAVAGFGYRMVDAFAIAVGGNAAATTSVDILATLTTSRKLVAFLVAGLTRSTVLRAGAATNGVVLADGVSFTRNDVNTAVTVGKTDADVTTATHIDVHFSYVMEA